MKSIDIPCDLRNSTPPIYSSMDLLFSESPSSSTSTSSSAIASSSSSTIGGRAIDRYNPIITDEKRRGAISKSAPTTPCFTNHSVRTPVTPLIMHARKKKSKKLTQTTMTNNLNIDNIDKENGVFADDINQVEGRRKSFSKPSDLNTKGSTITRSGVNDISPPESSRYLLDDTSFLDVLSDFDPALKLVPLESNKPTEDVKPNIIASKTQKLSSTTSSSAYSDQVVVLRVSLHCRGCERKLKKHLASMAGVKSFNIDFAAKKVTVVGDVTPLGVLANISKVKNAQLWTPTISSPFPPKQGGY